MALSISLWFLIPDALCEESGDMEVSVSFSAFAQRLLTRYVACSVDSQLSFHTLHHIHSPISWKISSLLKFVVEWILEVCCVNDTLGSCL
jgi:hypothetical protein